MKPRHIRAVRRSAVAALGLWAAGAAWAEHGHDDPTRLSLAELMNVEVSTSARKPQALSDTAAAVHVITRDDIRRAGATSLPEALRLAPGVQVSRIDASHYAITIRGFSSHYAGKILVLQDGRSLVSPLFNATFWETQDPMLDDIERIEVIRGPGGTMWGANAVNGVINIITRPARDTQGSLVRAAAGSDESGVAVRQGGSLGEEGHFRVFGQTRQHDALTDNGGHPAHQGLRQQRAGFRIDLQPSARDSLTLQGDVQAVSAGITALDTQVSIPGTHYAADRRTDEGANLLLRWEREVGPDHHLHLQAYVDHTRGRADWLDHDVDTLDLEFQQRLRLNAVHELTWGAGWRHVRDRTRGSLTLSFDPASVRSEIRSLFVQDEVTLSDRLRLTVGSKFEHNRYTGMEVQPSLRLHWQATPTDSFWASASRAVETPSRATQEALAYYFTEPALSANNPLPLPVLVGVRGTAGLRAQTVQAHEIGYRSLLSDTLSLDLTAFHNRYSHLFYLGGAPAYSVGANFGEAVYAFSNDLQGTASGIELATNWQVNPDWRLSASVSTLRTRRWTYSGAPADTLFGAIGASPSHMWQLHSQWNLANHLDLDAHLYRTARLNGDLNYAEVPPYTRLDLRLAWRPQAGVELSLTGRNLLQRRHREAQAEDVLPSDIRRSWLLQGQWTF